MVMKRPYVIAYAFPTPLVRPRRTLSSSIYFTSVMRVRSCRRPRVYRAERPCARLNSGVPGNSAKHNGVSPIQSCTSSLSSPSSGENVAEENEDCWQSCVVPGRVVEVWYKGMVAFGAVVDRFEHGALVSVVPADRHSCRDNGSVRDAPLVKVSFGEMIAIWPKHLCPREVWNGSDHPRPLEALASDVEAGMQLIHASRPRSLNLLKVYDAMSRLPKTDPSSQRTSFRIAAKIFPMFMRGPRERRAAATVATAILMGSDSVRFKRALSGTGWRALPPSVVASRSRTSFVDVCHKMLDVSTPARDRVSPWSRDHLEILRELEICAASGAAAKGTPATALKELGYEATDDGAAALLLDVGYWTTGTIARHGGGTTQSGQNQDGKPEDGSPQVRLQSISNGSKSSHSTKVSKLASKKTRTEANARKLSSSTDAGNSQGGQKSQVADGPEPDKPKYSLREVRDWTFPPSILAEARDLRTAARQRRARYHGPDVKMPAAPRRSLLPTKEGEAPLRVYCVDDKNARFLDDALSVEVVEPGRMVRVCVHVADVDEIVHSGSSIDELARERGQSLYLPLKPLHMLPAAAMDAASFTTSSPTEALTAMMLMDIVTGELDAWDVFSSVIPPVMRVNYDQFDAALNQPEDKTGLDKETLFDLKMLASIAPLLTEKLDTRREGRKLRKGGIRMSSDTNGEVIDSSRDDTGVAAVKLVRRRENGAPGGTVKVAHVVDFRTTGSHAAVAAMLVSASTLFRQFAHRNGAFLPEDRMASQYVARCGTAPMRRYADLATQRQIKCIIFGRQPAGRRRMEELRAWLAKRHAAGERSVATRRRAALYESLADHCAQQRKAAKLPYALLAARVRSVTVTRRRTVKAEVGIDGTGLYTTMNVSEDVALAAGLPKGTWSDPPREKGALPLPLKGGDRVQIRVSSVDTVGQRIIGEVVSKVG